MTATPFWQRPLPTLSNEEWEALCDGCGQCCMRKFEVEDSAGILLTNVPCGLFDPSTCQCGDYGKRLEQIQECVDIRTLSREQFRWLPPHCAYRLRSEERPLPAWHPLLNDAPDGAVRGGVSMRDRCAMPPAAIASDDAALTDFAAERIWTAWD